MPSSVVSTISYDTATATLRIIFVSGMIYDYKNVPEDVYQEMKKDGEKEREGRRESKGKHPFSPIK